jgi:type II secretory pathway pseudopilin PulG
LFIFKNLFNKNNGFTLTEMTIVVGTIAVLITLFFPNISMITTEAKNVVTKLNNKVTEIDSIVVGVLDSNDDSNETNSEPEPEPEPKDPYVFEKVFTHAAITENGEIVVWGDDSEGQVSDAPTDSGYIDIIPMVKSYLAINSDGTATAWGIEYGAGMYDSGQVTDLPYATDYVDASSDTSAVVLVKEDGSLVHYGREINGISSDLPTSSFFDFSQVSIGTFGLGIMNGGYLRAWGDGHYAGPSGFQGYGLVDDKPSGSDFVDIVAGGSYGLALRNDGSIEAWGADEYGQDDNGIVRNVPSGSNFVKIVGGSSTAYALTTDGSIVGWGDGASGKDIPTENGFVDIAYDYAVKADGSIVGWGYLADEIPVYKN